ISIFSNTAAVYRSTCRGIWFHIKLISYAITVRIRKYRSWQLHVVRLVDLVVSIIQWVKPPKRFGVFSTKREIQTYRKEVGNIVIAGLSNCSQSIFLPLLTVKKVGTAEVKPVFNSQTYFRAQFKLNT